MPTERTNQQWIQALNSQGSQQEEAIGDLRKLLLRSTLFTLVKNLQDLRDMDERERLAMAEDCTQDALQAVLAHLVEFRGDSKFTTWAYKFGINIALSRVRKERWRHISLEALTEEDDPLEWIRWKDSTQSTGSEMPSLQAEVRTVIQEVVQGRLTGRQRQVLKWIAFDDVPMDVVVERLNSNRNAIYKLLHDARLKIKQHLAARGYDVEEVYDLFRVG
jgi:RNA polymerase sigma-70 factor (ECF subfamily)